MTIEQKIDTFYTFFGNGSAKFATVTAQMDCEDLFYKSNRHNKELEKKPPFDPSQIFHERTYHLNFNFIYENSVNNQQRREGIEDPNFQTKSNWFEHVEKWLVKKKSDPSEHYIFAKLEQTKYSDEYFFEGRLLEKNEVALMQPYRKEKKSIVATQENQSVKNIVECRAISLSKIDSIKCGVLVEF